MMMILPIPIFSASTVPFVVYPATSAIAKT